MLHTLTNTDQPTAQAQEQIPNLLLPQAVRRAQAVAAAVQALSVAGENPLLEDALAAAAFVLTGGLKREEVSSDAQRFVLCRDEDETGVSGTGDVADGVRFPDGTVAMRWRTGTASTAVYDSVADVEAIHGHGGKTRIVFVDAS